MRKIISLFKRDYEGDRTVYNEVVPGAEWVVNGEGVATRKWDGTCALFRDANIYKRYTWRSKKKESPPENFEPTTDIDPETGKQEGWVPIDLDDPADKWIKEAFYNYIDTLQTVTQDFNLLPYDGTYEVCGPKINGNPENLTVHSVFCHEGQPPLQGVPRDFEGLKDFFRRNDVEGIVWHHPDGRMVKIKAKDFGIKRGELASLVSEGVANE